VNQSEIQVLADRPGVFTADFIVAIEFNMAHWTEQQLSELKETFNMIDVDKDGVIQLSDLVTTFTSLGKYFGFDKATCQCIRLGQHPTDQRLNEMMEQPGNLARDPITFPIFVQLMSHQTEEATQTRESLLEYCLVLDKDKNGTMDVERFQKWTALSEEQVARLTSVDQDSFWPIDERIRDMCQDRSQNKSLFLPRTLGFSLNLIHPLAAVAT
jgi:Ca2+-binding EF-hand superfamily protein